MVNKVIIIGNLGQDPQSREAAGQTVAELRVATSRSWNDKASGQRKEETEWHTVEVWGKQADACLEYLAKGRSVYVEGRLKTDKWEKDGQKKERVKIVAENVRFIGGGEKGSSGPQRAAREDTAAPAGGNSDIPF